jgi:hypothetical protein
MKTSQHKLTDGLIGLERRALNRFGVIRVDPNL